MPYFILTAFDHSISRFDLLFGDYDREVINQEKEDQKDHDYDGDYSEWTVHRLANDRQETIDAFMFSMNKPVAA